MHGATLKIEDAIFRLIHEILNALNSKIMVGNFFFGGGGGKSL
jgi:hypothetical protein